MSSEIELLKRRLRERTAELDRLLLAVQPHGLHAHASTDSAGDFFTRMRWIVAYRSVGVDGYSRLM
eukprot:3539-Eustigmatos_ZCMA.PRE.1